MTLPGFDQHEREALNAKPHDPELFAQSCLTHEHHNRPSPDHHVQHVQSQPDMPFHGFPAENLSAYAAPHAVLYPAADHFSPSTGVSYLNASPPWVNPYLQQTQDMLVGQAYTYNHMYQDNRPCPTHAQTQHTSAHTAFSNTEHPVYFTPSHLTWHGQPSGGLPEAELNSLHAGAGNQMQASSPPGLGMQCMQQSTFPTWSVMRNEDALLSTAECTERSTSANLQLSTVATELCTTAAQVRAKAGCSPQQTHSDNLGLGSVKVISRLYQVRLKETCSPAVNDAC